MDCLGLLAREREPRLLYSLPDLVAVERVAPVGGGLLRQGNERPLLRDMQRRGQLGLPRLLDLLPVELGFLPVLAHPFGHEALGYGVDVGGLSDAMRDQAAQRGGADIADPDHGAVLQLLLQPGQRRLIRFLQPFLWRERRHWRAMGLHARIVPAERLGLSLPGGEVGHVVLAQLFRNVPSNPGAVPCVPAFSSPARRCGVSASQSSSSSLAYARAASSPPSVRLEKCVRTWSGIASSRAMPVSGSSETDACRRSLRCCAKCA